MPRVPPGACPAPSHPTRCSEFGLRSAISSAVQGGGQRPSLGRRTCERCRQQPFPAGPAQGLCVMAATGEAGGPPARTAAGDALEPPGTGFSQKRLTLQLKRSPDTA